LVQDLRGVFKDQQFVISTITPTGNKIAKGMAREGDFVTYLPLDFGFMAKKVIDRINPALFIIAETELWPNLISYLNNKKIPIIVVNGRISDRSLRGYLSIKFITRHILNKITLFCVQTHNDRERLMRLGVVKDKIRVTGNMKFDGKADSKNNYCDTRRKLDIKSNELLFIAASTHPGEEEIILRVYRELLSAFPTLRLLLVPRHPERAAAVSSLTKKSGFEAQSISLLNSRTQEPKNPRTIFILDSVGDLLSFYNIADIVFVGGSLVKIGGHNILEPAALGKPVMFGPYMFNFRDIADLFLSEKAALLVHNQEELKTKIKYLLNNPSAAAEITQRAQELILKNQGATKKNVELIKAASLD
jgi:3-deoxy-D-manno-octulosonic-acid transferase